MATTSRRSAPPALVPHVARLTLAIDGTPYGVRPARGEDVPSEATRVFVLTRSDRRLGKVRHVVAMVPAGLVCSCGDARYRQLPLDADCKHCAACRVVGLF